MTQHEQLTLPKSVVMRVAQADNPCGWEMSLRSRRDAREIGGGALEIVGVHACSSKVREIDMGRPRDQRGQAQRRARSTKCTRDHPRHG